METRVHTTHTHTHKRILSSACWPAHPRTADSPKDGHNLFYNRLVSAQVENVTTYLCWQDAIPERAINRRGLTALPSASRAPSTSNPTTAAPTPTTTSSCCTLSQSKLIVFLWCIFSHQQFKHQLLRPHKPPQKKKQLVQRLQTFLCFMLQKVAAKHLWA